MPDTKQTLEIVQSSLAQQAVLIASMQAQTATLLALLDTLPVPALPVLPIEPK